MLDIVLLVVVVIVRVLKRALFQFGFRCAKLPITAGFRWRGLGRARVWRINVAIAHLTCVALVKVLCEKVIALLTPIALLLTA